jgi:TM2 domain-containing membrane protein YozV
MGKWADGKTLSNKSWGLLKENKYFLWFPIMGLLLAMFPLVILGSGALTLAALGMNVLAIVVGFIGLILINFAFTISGAAMVAAVDEELSGRDSTLGYGFGKAFRRLGPLLVWSVIRAVVSALLGLLRGNGGGAAAVAGNILAAIGAAAWSIVTFFVTPYIMLKGLSAVPALKASVHMVREKWGTQVTGGVRIGLRLLVITLPAIALIVGGFYLLTGSGASVSLGLVLLAVGFVLIMISALLSAALQAIFSVALFHFTTGEGGYGPFTPEELNGVLTKK